MLYEVITHLTGFVDAHPVQILETGAAYVPVEKAGEGGKLHMLALGDFTAGEVRAAVVLGNVVEDVVQPLHLDPVGFRQDQRERLPRVVLGKQTDDAEEGDQPVHAGCREQFVQQRPDGLRGSISYNFV